MTDSADVVCTLAFLHYQTGAAISERNEDQGDAGYGMFDSMEDNDDDMAICDSNELTSTGTTAHSQYTGMQRMHCQEHTPTIALVCTLFQAVVSCCCGLLSRISARPRCVHH
jgi:hypothetical protein